MLQKHIVKAHHSVARRSLPQTVDSKIALGMEYASTQYARDTIQVIAKLLHGGCKEAARSQDSRWGCLENKSVAVREGISSIIGKGKRGIPTDGMLCSIPNVNLDPVVDSKRKEIDTKTREVYSVAPHKKSALQDKHA